MLTLEDMIIRLLIALVLGAIIGIEREFAGKEAGIRTDLMVAAGASIFAMISITLPYIIAISPEDLPNIIARNSGFLGVIANVVVGIGFLGAGIIIKQGTRVKSLTTAATIWFAASVGILVGIGLVSFAIVATLGITLLLFTLRKLKFMENIGKKGNE